MNWMLMPFRKYADFSGRSRRKELWMFILLGTIVNLVAVMIMFAGMPWQQIAQNAQSNSGDYTASSDYSASTEYSASVGATGNIGEAGAAFWIGLAILGIWSLAALIPTLAVCVRRLHDQDKSGWFYLLNFVPFGGLVLLVFYFLEGTRGPNRYGPDPKGDPSVHVFG